MPSWTWASSKPDSVAGAAAGAAAGAGDAAAAAGDAGSGEATCAEARVRRAEKKWWEKKLERERIDVKKKQNVVGAYWMKPSCIVAAFGVYGDTRAHPCGRGGKCAADLGACYISSHLKCCCICGKYQRHI